MIRSFVFTAVTLVFGLSLGLMSTGCSLNTGDTLPPPPPHRMHQPDIECVNPSVSVMQKYFQGTSSTDEVHAAWQCFDRAIRKFSLETKGANPNYFTASELRVFFQTYYLNGETISDSFLADIMRLKQLLIGGDSKTLAKADLNYLRHTFHILEEETVRLQPFVPLFLSDLAPEEAQKNSQTVEAALSSLVISTRNLSLIFERNSITYTQDDIKSLLHNVGLFVGNWKAPEDAIAYLPAFSVMKQFIVGGTADEITCKEIVPWMQRVGRIVAIHLRVRYLLTDADLTKGAGLHQLEATLSQTFALLKEIAQSQPNQTIGFAQTEHLLDEVAKLDLLPPKFPRANVESAFHLVVDKLLIPSKAKSDGVSLQGINALQTITTTFIERQKAWESLKETAGQKGMRSDEALPLPVVRDLWGKANFVGAPNDPISRLLARSRPPTFTEEGVLRLNNGSAAISDLGFVRMNIITLIQGLLFKAYSSDATLSPKEFSTFFGDFFDLGQAFKVFQPKDRALSKSAFDEANIFTLEARNDSRLTDFEFFDYVGEVVGAGVMSRRVSHDLEKSCRAVGLDALKHKTYETSCFRQLASQNFDEYFDELPEWVRVSRQMKKQGSWSDFELALEAAARAKGSSTTVTERSDLTRVTMVMQYIETLYVRFDHNHDGFLDYDEALEALPLFQPLLREASGFKSDKKIVALFMYILVKGRAPTSVGDKIDFIASWSRKPSKWQEAHADRYRLLSVVAAMAKK